MFSVIDECMHACINVRSLHWILLSIQVDAGKVDVIDPLEKDPTEYEIIVYMLRR
jgi:hypothetical protein